MKTRLRRFNRLFVRLSLLLTLFLGSSGNAPDAIAGTSSLVGELAVRMRGISNSGPRISVLSDHHTCPAANLSPGVIPQHSCKIKLLSTRSARRLRLRVEHATHSPDDPDALHAAALIDILSDQSDSSLAEAIKKLDSASRITNHPAAILADLGAAHLLLAQRQQSTRDLVMAIDAAARALEVEPQNASALYNLALALHWFGLDQEAGIAWKHFLGTDSTSTWADEARRWLRALGAVAHQPAPPVLDGHTDALELAAYAAASPQEARLLGNSLLGDWATAFLGGDSVRAASLLWQTQVIAEILERRGGDSTLGDALRAINRNCRDLAAMRKIAHAHEEYAAFEKTRLRRDFKASRMFLSRASLTQGSSKVLRPLAGTPYIGVSFHSRWRSNPTYLNSLILQADTVRHPAFAGRLHWMLGDFFFRAGQYERAREELQLAARLFARIGEREHLGAIQHLAAQVELMSGDTAAAYELVRATLNALRPYRVSTWKSSTLYVAAKTATENNLLHAAALIQNEALGVAIRTGTPRQAVQARLSRAHIFNTAGKEDDTAAEVKTIQNLMVALPPGFERDSLEGELYYLRARIELRNNPARAYAMADSAVRRLFRNSQREAAAMALLAEASLALGNLSRSALELRGATRLAAISGPTQRSSSLLNSLATLHHRVVMSAVNAGKADAGLAFFERGRTALIHRDGTGSKEAPQQLAAPLGRVVIEYLLIGDTLLTWTIAGTAVQMTRSTIPRQKLSRTITDTRLALELRPGDNVLLPQLQLLYDWLIRPVQTRIGAENTPLVIVTDGEIGNVPFSALFDANRRRYLVEDHPLHLARSLEEAFQKNDPATVRETAVLVIADPAFDTKAYRDLTRLPAARAEADSIAKEYPNSRLVTDDNANQLALEAGFLRANLLHFAGHAFYNTEHPDRSFLVLAPLRGRAGTGELSAAEIQSLDLRHIRLVVLAACETLRSQGGWPDAYPGLASALLTAGADGVVGSMWRVRDDLTRSLMIRFHRAYSVSGDGAAALRNAQLTLLRSNDPNLRSPSAWAGFQYIGN